MKRVRAATLVLVNWKGVFYERYALDDHVTALEGDNGAGKTTVMIAAYIALLPDMTRLRFSNVGESDATGGDKGIWGRLGNPNRPSYAALEFELGGQQVVAGVHLEPKGEPSVELTPFLISELSEGVRLQDALLVTTGGQDFVPELRDLRENVARLGGRIEVFQTAKEYFATLFERGITPLRLVVDEERTRFNDMLRTSMTGGISRALTSEFRAFLLKEETGLADTLVRMRANIDACRRTRMEVTESQELEREISGVYDAGHAMFAASLLATRERAAELRRRVEDAKQERDQAQTERDGVARDHGKRIQERADVERRFAATTEQYNAARALFDSVTRAHVIATRIDGLNAELDDVMSLLARAAAELRQAEDLRARRSLERRRAETAYRTAAEGLADVQRGLQELHRRADAHRAVIGRLAEARLALDAPDLDASNLQAHEEVTQVSISAIDRARSELDAAISSAAVHRGDHSTAMSALTVILGREVQPPDADAEARACLRKLAELEMHADRAASVEAELRKTRASQERQAAARATAESLAQPGGPLTSSRDVLEALREAETQAQAVEDQVREHIANADAGRRTQERLREREKALQTRQARWRELDVVALRLEATLGAGLRSAKELEAARGLLDAERDNLQRRLESLQKDFAEVKARAQLLEQTGGVFHVDLLSARDIVGGELLAGHFDDLDPAQAARVQAQLGPLADAIVVEDARQAAAELQGHDRELDTIWFVEGGGLRDLVEPHGSGDDHAKQIVVRQNGVVRSTLLPQRPTLGRKARRRLIAELHERAEELSTCIREAESQLFEVDSRRRDAALLTRELGTLELGDPGSELANIGLEQEQLASRVEGHLGAADDARARATHVAQRADRLRELLSEASLLDEPELAPKVAELERTVRSAGRARAELKRVAKARRTLSEHIEVLRRLPMTDAEVDERRVELSNLTQRRHGFFLALDALRYVAANRDALGWTDAEESLSAKRELVPALKAQCDSAESEQRAAIKAAEEADGSWEEARKSWRGADDQRSAIEASREQAMRELADSGIEDASQAAVDRERERVDVLGALVGELDRSERTLARDIAQLEERLDSRARALADAEDRLGREEREWRPAQELWERLRARAETRGLLTPAMSERLLETGAGSVNLRSEARSQEKLLEERLRIARGGSEILNSIQARLSRQDQTTGDDDIEVWELVRDWLRRRVPAQIAEVADPLEALQRLRHHLAALAERLEGQEAELRGASEDVARGIEVHIRSAHRQVRLLNHELEGVHFGTIRGMRIRLSRDDRMEGVLNALRQGSAQELLFATTMPVEEALDALFTRYGGRGPTVGQRLLDYREYLDIAVEVQRQASADWERVNASRLSTGEAIGVGTALMMVVLTAWEQSANLFRARRSVGTLRLLFLDEANRLSQDNLQVLFELCTALDLQLLIASPEVARAPGCTTYRLVRRETADGGEEVVVSGRRAIARAVRDVEK